MWIWPVEVPVRRKEDVRERVRDAIGSLYAAIQFIVNNETGMQIFRMLLRTRR